MPNAFLAVELNNGSVRAFRFDVRFRSAQLAAMTSRVVTPDLDLGAAVVSALEEIADEKGAVTLFLPPVAFWMRNLSVPFSGSRRIRQILPMELGGHLAVAPEGCEIDFAEQGAGMFGGGGHVFAAATNEPWMAPVLAAVSEAGFIVNGVRLAPLAAASFLREKCDCGKKVAVVDTRGSMVVFGEEKPVCVRAFGCPDNPEAASLSVYRALADICCVRYPEASPEAVLVYGPMAEEVGAAVSERTGIAVSIPGAALFSDLDPEHLLLEDPDAIASAWAAVCEIEGNAGFRFHEAGLRLDRIFSAHRTQVIVSGLLTLFAAGLFAFATVSDLGGLAAREKALDQEIRAVFTKSLPKVTRIVDPLHQMGVKLSELEQASAFSASGKGNRRMIDVMKALASGAPEGVDLTLTRLAVTAEQLTVSGDTDTYNSVDALKHGLSANKMFSAVTISSASADKDGGRIRFSLRADF